METIADLRAKQANLLHEARQIIDLGEREKRELTAAERERRDTVLDEASKVVESIQNRERDEQRAREVAKQEDEARAAAERAKSGVRTDPGVTPDVEKAAVEVRAALLSRWLRADRGALIHTTPEERAALLAESRLVPGDEKRALQAEATVLGGALVTPLQMSGALIKSVDDRVWGRQFGTIIPVTMAESLGAVSLDADPADADWTSELATGSEDSTMAFGKRELRPRPLAKRIKVSRKLLRLAANAAGIVTDRLSYKFAVTMEKAWLTGTGANQPLGIYTASNDGIPTSRDVTFTAQTAIDGDKLIEMVTSLKAGYTGRWIGSRTFLRQAMQLKGGDGHYLWLPTLRDEEPGTLLGRPLHISEYNPATFTSGQYVCAFGDFRFYWWADALSLEIQRLEELYAETNQIGLIGRLESDGMPVLAEAFVRGKLA